MRLDWKKGGDSNLPRRDLGKVLLDVSYSWLWTPTIVLEISTLFICFSLLYATSARMTCTSTALRKMHSWMPHVSPCITHSQNDNFFRAWHCMCTHRVVVIFHRHIVLDRWLWLRRNSKEIEHVYKHFWNLLWFSVLLVLSKPDFN